MLQNCLFSALASRSGFGAPISDTVARSSIVFCNLVSADRIVMAASRLLGAAAACAILLSFAVEDCKSYWRGCIQAAIVICQQIFTLLTLLIFLFKNPFKSASKSSFFCFGVEMVLELLLPTPLSVVLLFCNSVSADRIVMAALRLLGHSSTGK